MAYEKSIPPLGANITLQVVKSIENMRNNRYVLLSIVYKVVGIRDDYIRECKKRLNYSTFERDVSVILKERKDTNYTSWAE